MHGARITPHTRRARAVGRPKPTGIDSLPRHPPPPRPPTQTTFPTPPKGIKARLIPRGARAGVRRPVRAEVGGDGAIPDYPSTRPQDFEPRTNPCRKDSNGDPGRAGRGAGGGPKLTGSWAPKRWTLMTAKMDVTRKRMVSVDDTGTSAAARRYRDSPRHGPPSSSPR